MIPSEASWNVIVIMIGAFGSIITLLLTVIGILISRWSTRLDLRLDSQDDRITTLERNDTKHSTELKNLHHRLK